MNYPDSFSGLCDAARFKGRRGTALPSGAFRGSGSASPLRSAFLPMGQVPIIIHVLAADSRPGNRPGRIPPATRIMASRMRSWVAVLLRISARWSVMPRKEEKEGKGVKDLAGRACNVQGDSLADGRFLDYQAAAWSLF